METSSPGERSPVRGTLAEVWQRYLSSARLGDELRTVILESRQRSCAAGVHREGIGLPARVSEAELARRQQVGEALIAVAYPHLEWLSVTFSQVMHVAYVTDRDGIVLCATGDPDLQRRFGVTPGHDWSERSMGTNGAGTALAADRPVAVIGAEHYASAFEHCTSTAAPLHLDGQLIGAINVGMRAADASPERLLLVQHIAFMMERELRDRAALEREEHARQLAERLRESEERLRLALRGARAGAWEWDLHENTARWSPELYELLGADPAQPPPRGDYFLTLIDREDCEHIRREFALAAEAGGPLDFEFRVRRVDSGEQIWLSSVGRIEFDPQGKPLRAIGINQDITAHKRAEEALRESERRAARQLAEIETIYDSAPVGLAVLDRELRFVRINRRMAEMNGPPIETHLGRTVHEVLPDLASTAQCLADRVLGGDPVLDIEIAGETPAQPGVKRSWIESWYPLKDEAGVVRAINVVAEEVTERRRAEERLRENEERLRLALEASHAGIWEWDIVSGRARWSAETCLLHGIVPRETPLLGAQWERTVEPEDVAAVMQAFGETLRGERGEYRAEYRVRHPSRGEVWLLGMGRVQRTADGQPQRILGIVLDITERKRAEEHRELLTRELTHRVKNTLAVVQSIASQTLRRARTLDEFRVSFGGRLEALAAAHELLLGRAGWADVGLRELLERTLLAVAPLERVELEGEPVTVSAHAAVSLGMAFHELATNASKYGSLSSPRGHLRVSWRRAEHEAEGQLALEWRESGGPPAEAPRAEARGFGSRLIEQVAREVGAGIEREWSAAGLVCRLTLPIGSHVALGR